ncbi:MAG: TorD/DmsD family molecular chaperone [Thermodesulfobacteriota bacterium]
MMNQEKEYFCQLLASLFYPPDVELVKQIRQRTLYSFFEEYIESQGEEKDILKGFIEKERSENLLEELKDEYDRLFSGLSQDSISLVESSYKPWTEDPHCPLPFASERGLLMGDSALHLLEVYNQCGLEASEEFKGCPDHMAMELEFLSYLYRWATDVEIKLFIEDHLNWIPLLKEELNRCDPHPFYVSALEVLALFLDRERERLEGR